MASYLIWSACVATNEGNRAMKDNRKRIWIDPFQTGLLIRIAVYLLLFQVVVWAFTAVCEQLNIAATAAGAEGHLLSSSTVRILLALLVLSPPLVLDAVRFAYRLVGPLYRFRKTIQAIAAGEPVALVQLRQGDLLGEFKDDFNSMLKTLEEKGLILLKDAQKAVNPETAANCDSCTEGKKGQAVLVGFDEVRTTG